MYKLNLPVGNSLIQILNKPFHKDSHKIRAYLEQHNIPYTDKVKSYYLQSLDQNSKEAFKQYLASFANIKGGFQKVNIGLNTLSALEELIEIARKDPQHNNTLVAEISEIRENDINGVDLYRSTDMLSQNLSNILYRYSKPFSIGVKRNENITWFKDWFKNILKNEDHIYIYDAYIINDNGLQAMRDVYLPAISYNTKVSIFICKRRYNNEPNINTLFNIFSGYNMKLYNITHKSDLHDRHIVSYDNWEFTVEAGFDRIQKNLYDSNKLIALTKTKISLSDKIDTLIPPAHQYQEISNPNNHNINNQT